MSVGGDGVSVGREGGCLGINSHSIKNIFSPFFIHLSPLHLPVFPAHFLPSPYNTPIYLLLFHPQHTHLPTTPLDHRNMICTTNIQGIQSHKASYQEDSSQHIHFDLDSSQKIIITCSFRLGATKYCHLRGIWETSVPGVNVGGGVMGGRWVGAVMGVWLYQ